MGSLLGNTTKRALVADRNRRGLVEASCAAICCGGECLNYIKSRWCCDNTREVWISLNKPECFGYRPDLPTVSETAPSIVSVGGTCYETDPSDVVAIIPVGGIFGGFVDSVVGGCSDPACGDCPDCCGAVRNYDGPCGWPMLSEQSRHCCVCGNSYTLMVTSRSRSTSRAHYAEPCLGTPLMPPPLGPLEYETCESTWTATYYFGCRVIDGIASRYVQTIGGGWTYRREKKYARIVFNFGPSCQLISFGQGRTDVDTREGRPMDYGGSDGCGLLRDNAANIAPGEGCAYWPYSEGIRRFDSGECSGDWYDPSYDNYCAGNPLDVNCQWAMPPGAKVEWSGWQTCQGGSYSSRGAITSQYNTTRLRAEVSVNGQPFEDTDGWGGVQYTDWETSLEWNTTDGGPCPGDPCASQHIVPAPATIHPGTETALGSLLATALSTRARGGCRSCK